MPRTSPPSILYRTWLGMRNRCNNLRTSDYRYYGGRGVRVCLRWDDYHKFAADVGPHPGPGWTLDRIDTSGHYEPDNCRWATRRTQARNRAYCKLTKETADLIRKNYVRGQTRQSDIAKQFGVTQTSVSQIIRGVTWL